MRSFVDNELATGKFIGRLLKGGGVARPRAIPIMKSVREALLRLGLHGQCQGHRAVEFLRRCDQPLQLGEQRARPGERAEENPRVRVEPRPRRSGTPSET